MKRYLALFIFFLLSTNIFTQNKNFGFEFDYALFRHDSTSNYLELYYSFNQKDLTIQSNDTMMFVEGILKIIIMDSSEENIFVDREWRVRGTHKDSTDLYKSLIGQIGFLLPEGTYRAIVGGKDGVDTSFSRFYSELFRVNIYPKNRLSISDLQIASRIVQESPNVNSIFYKNSLEITPLPSSIFGINQPVLFYYTELYNLLLKENPDPYKITTVVLNSRGRVIYNRTKKILPNVDSRVEMGAITLTKYPTDTYSLVVSLIDSAANYNVSSFKKFFVYNPDIIDSTTFASSSRDFLSSQFGVMSVEECDEIFEKSKYIATTADIAKYLELTAVEAKREFLFNFWSNRDDPFQADDKDYFTEYFKRIDLANVRYNTLAKQGWKTDRGRIFTIYGDPSEIDRYPNQIDSKPYEIWQFNSIEGGVIFIFADLTGFSDFRLIHSTKRGELRDENWQRRLLHF